jgi:hypothetical protein
MLQSRKISNPRSDPSQNNNNNNNIQMVVLDQTNKNSINLGGPVVIGKNIISGVNGPPATSQYDDGLGNPMNLEWIYKPFIQRIVRICGLISFISICANTPETFNKYKMAKYFTYASDLVTTLVFTVEMIAKIKIRGLFKGEYAYIFDRWCQFDGIMVIFHIISVILQVNLFYYRSNNI